MHFRSGNTDRRKYNFKIGNDALEIVDQYKSLSVIFLEKRGFVPNCEAVLKAAGRALCSTCMISNHHNLKYFGFNSFEKLFS